MRDNGLPEEKLLSLIRKSDDVSSPEPGYKKNALSKAGGSLKRIGEYLRLKAWLARMIVLSFILSLAFFLFSWVSQYLPFDSRTDIPGDAKGSLERAEAQRGILSLEAYLGEINKKDIFYSSYPKKYDTRDVSLDAVKNMLLVGIIRDEPAQAVFKEKKSGDLFYLKKGERTGEFTLLEIQEDKVVVEYRGEMFEIHL